jgi:hypothetical protein
MGTKLNPGFFDCHTKALDDEPLFTLLARDPSAPELIEIWAALRLLDIKRGRREASDMMLVEEAMQCASDMCKWRTANFGRWRQPQPA